MSLRLPVLAFSAAALVAVAAFAEAPASSPRPELRPGSAATASAALRPVTRASTNAAVRIALSDAAPGLRVSPVPVPRPRVAVRTARPAAVAESPGPERVVLASTATATPAPAPPKRPKGLLAAIFRAPDKPVRYPKKGSVCGDPSIRGQAIPPIPAKLRGCGLPDGVRVTSVDGVALSTPANIDCTTAKALKRWVAGSVKPAVARLGGGVASLKVAAHYSCRTRNNRPGAKISEHGRGRAIDISAINLKNGSSITVLRGWNDRFEGPILRKVHAGACGPFGTVLGPNADRYHLDHFHFDTARHRGGAYCR
ncbi:MAG: extensin family protein [Rhodobacter sp.]|nr:extensin family protein [Rhodobacter sp.]